MTANAPLVSVILPVYNGGRFLREAIESVLSQSFKDFELIIINDGSTDDSAAIIDPFHDPRIRTITNERNIGLIASLNTGIAQARGTLIARMDADDRMYPERITKQVNAMEADPGIAVLATLVERVNADGEPLGAWDTDRACTTEESIATMLSRTNCIAHPSVMMRATALRELRYDPRHPGAEDWDLWLRMRARGYRIAKLPEVLLAYRVHAGSVMGIQKREVQVELRLMRHRWRFLRKEWSTAHLDRWQLSLLMAQARNAGGFLLRRVVHPLVRDVYRVLAYSPIKLWREAQALSSVERNKHGRMMFLFPYLHLGGAEQVHAEIVATVAEQRPLIVIFGRSKDHSFAERFRKSGTLLEIPRLLHHPLTRTRTHQRLADILQRQQNTMLFGALSSVFFDLLPLLPRTVRTIYLQHAFLFQPEGNMWWKLRAPLIPLVDEFVFVSRHALHQFDRFLLISGLDKSERNRSRFISNAVDSFGEIKDHDKIGILFVGRDSPEKRVDLFLALCAALEAARPGLFRFTAVGVAKRPENTEVDFVGTVTEKERIKAIYAAHDILVVTSDREGFPLVIMEAMAEGCTILSTPVGDVPNRLDPDLAFVTSSVEQEFVLEEMTLACMALAADSTRLRSMRQNALAHARKAFDPATFIANYRALFDVIKGNA